MLTQLWLMAAIALLALGSPAVSPLLVAIAALMVATASATQDIIIDAFRVESLPEDEQAFDPERIDDDVLGGRRGDRKSTRLNSSHQIISYAVFCLKKKKRI